VTQLGEGAFAEVMVASHTKTDTNYAVKIVDTSSLTRNELKALHTEMGVMSILQHEHIVGLHEIYTVDTHFYYMVMEYIQGGELLDRLVQKEYYSEKEARNTALALFDAIAYCHSQKIAHRDLKLENLLLVSADDDANVKICDFGFAKQCPEDGFRTFLGTPSYVAPEVITSSEGTGPYDCQCDAWSLGVICYILLSGYSPFGNGADERAMFRLVKSGLYEFHAEYWDPISENAKDFVSRLLTVNPDERLTAQQALQHPWLKADETSLMQDLPETLHGLKLFNGKRKFRAAVNTLIAAQRMSDYGDLDLDFSCSGYDDLAGEQGEYEEDPIILTEC
jgi:serine/threonine protein kinase